MSRNPEKLTCVSIIVCDDVYRDERTKRLIIVGTFSRITTAALPCRHQRMVVLFTLTNGRGRYELSLGIEHEQTGQVIVEVNGPLQQENPLAINEINVTLDNLVFPHEGKYWVVVKADKEIIGQRPFIVRVRGGEEKKGNENE